MKMALLSYAQGSVVSYKSLSSILTFSMSASDSSFTYTAIIVQLRFRKVIFATLLEARLQILCPAPSGILAMNCSLS